MAQQWSGGVDNDEPDRTAEVSGHVRTGFNYWPVAAVALILVAIVGGLAAFGDGGPALSETESELTQRESPGPSNESLQGAEDFLVSPDRPLSTTIPVTSTVAPTTLVPGQFLLGEPTGLWLFYGGQDPLQRLDLDNGELITYGIEAYPTLVAGDDLVLHQPESGVSGWVLAADPGEQALNWKQGPVAAGPEPNQLWVLDRGQEMEHPAGVAVGYGRWQLVDVAANRVLDRRPGDLYRSLEEQLTTEWGPLIERLRPVGADYSNRPDGIHAYEDDGYRRIGDGQVVTAAGSLLVIRRCTNVGVCTLAWLDGAGATPPGLPELSTDAVTALFLSDQLLLVGRADGGNSVIDLADGASWVFDDLRQITVSPDRRWLAGLDGDGPVVYDLLEQQQPFRFSLPVRSQDGALLLVEK